VIIKPTRPDWYCWLDADTDWCRANGELPGLQFENIRGRLAVNYHVSHVPCLPEAAVVDHNIVEQTRRQNFVLPFENSGLLRSYQFTDLQRLKLRKGALLGYGMRVGKTALACHLHNPNDGILLVVGPLAAREVWCDWIERTTGFPPWVLYGRKDAVAAPGYGAYFCHYDVLDAHTPFLVTQKIGTLVLDECFPIGTMVTTEQGAVPIEVLTGMVAPPRALARDASGRLVWAPIVAKFRKLNRSGLVRVQHEKGAFVCTPTHRIWTEESGYVQARHLTERHTLTRLSGLRGAFSTESGEWDLLRAPLPANCNETKLARQAGRGDVQDLSSRILDKATKFGTNAILQSSLPNASYCDGRLPCKFDSGARLDSDGATRLPGLWEVFPIQIAWFAGRHPSAVLQSALRGHSELGICEPTVSQRTCASSHAQAQRHLKSSGLIAHDFVQPNAGSGCCREGTPGESWAPISDSARRASEFDRTSGATVESSRQLANGTHNCDAGGMESIRGTAALVSGGRVESRSAACDRVGWTLARNAKAKSARCEENGHLGSSRVVGVTFLEQSGADKLGSRVGEDSFVYDIEVAGAHNFFADGVLVSNCHILQNASARANAVNACVFRSSKILGLSGTPMFNKPISMHRLLHLLTPGAWGSRFNFAKFFCDAQPGAHGWLYEGQSNAELFAARLETIMVRRTWQEVMPELPPTTRIIEPVDVTGATYVQLEAAAMKAALAAGNASQGGYLATLRHKLAEVKIKPAKQIAEQAAADGHKVVLWVWHVKIGDKVEKAMMGDDSRPVFRLQADDPAPKRQRILDAFRSHEGPCYLVASMGVGGVALDLSASDYAIFVELDWTPANVQQAEFRTFHRDRPHVVVYLHADDPTETKLIEVLDLKNSFANAIGLGFDDVARKVLSP